jgi:hypothetical protein
MFSQECYTVKEVTSSAQIEEMSQKRITFGIKQMTEELLSEKYFICQDGLPVIIDVYSIEAPSKGMSLGPFAKNKKQTIVKLKINLGNKELYGEGLAETSTQSMFLDLNDENLPFNKTSFASAIKKALELALN